MSAYFSIGDVVQILVSRELATVTDVSATGDFLWVCRGPGSGAGPVPTRDCRRIGRAVWMPDGTVVRAAEGDRRTGGAS